MGRRKFTELEITWIRQEFAKGDVYPSDVAVRFNEVFEREVNADSIRGVCKVHGIRRNELPPKNKLLNAEQDSWLRGNAKGRWATELVVMLKDRFGVELTVEQLRRYKKNNKITSGCDAKFLAGRKAGNKGIKPSPEVYAKMQPTMFKKGNRPKNALPVGTEVNREGYMWVKVAEPNKWKKKGRAVWEAANGPIPKGNRLIHADKNKLNDALENLLLVTAAELKYLNANKLISENAEITKAGVMLARLQVMKYRKKGEANDART